MAAAATTTEDRVPDVDGEPSLSTRLIGYLYFFLRDSVSTYIHKILITTDIALILVFGLSFGAVAPLAPALYALLAAHLLLYGFPAALGLWHFGIDGVNNFSPIYRKKFDITGRSSVLRKSVKRYPHWWLKWSVVIFGFPFVLADLQSRLSGTAPETTALIKTASPAVPVIQRYAVTLLTLLVLLRVFGFTIIFVFKYHVREAEILDEIQ